MPHAVRTLRPHDSVIAADLHAQCFEASGERSWSADEFRQLLRTPGCFGLLLMAGSRPVGLAMARLAADEAEILTLGVAPASRRQGGAALMLSALTRRCRRRGARRLFLEVAEDNFSARDLYEAHRFTVAGRRPAYVDRGGRGKVAALVLQCALD